MDTLNTSHDLVSSSDVNGEYVYSPDGEQIGHIDHLMIDKKSGNVAYAVMHFGGFLGMGEESHHVPWRTLSYDPAKRGFTANLTREQIEGAPRFRDDSWKQDREQEQRLHDHYGVRNPYWF